VLEEMVRVEFWTGWRSDLEDDPQKILCATIRGAPADTETVRVPKSLTDRLTDALGDAA
jgi:hypothetical protein